MDVPNIKLVSKILRSLTRSWNLMVTAILEAKNLMKLEHEQPIGAIITYEMVIL